MFCVIYFYGGSYIQSFNFAFNAILVHAKPKYYQNEFTCRMVIDIVRFIIVYKSIDTVQPVIDRLVFVCFCQILYFYTVLYFILNVFHCNKDTVH